MINKNIFVVIALVGVLLVAACATNTAPAPLAAPANGPSANQAAPTDIGAGSPVPADSIGTDLNAANAAAANDTLAVNESDLDLG